MRLTLRTMLAYIDDILEPEDAEAIGKRIEQSEFATTLLHRTRDVMRRLRLGTPDLTDRGAGLDPNTVAEYLDNSLADDRVLDFEKVCLESDVHLAEVASCHQILALVLGEPAEVDPASRQRMYQLLELERTGAAEAAESEAAKLVAARHARAKTGAPEKTADRTQRRRSWLPMAVAVTAALACGILLLAVTGQLEPGSILGDLLELGRADQSTAMGPEPSQIQAGSPLEPPAEGGVSGEALPSGAGEPDSQPPAATESVEPAGEAPPPAVVTNGVGRAEPPGQLVPVTAVGAPPMPEPAASPPLTQPPIASAADTAGERETPQGEEPAPGAEAQPGAGQQANPAPLPTEFVGQLNAPAHVLLGFDPGAGAWKRLRDQEPLVAQAGYLSLPTYRPMLQLVDQTRIWLIGSCQIELMPSDQEGVEGLVVDHGRLIVEAPETAEGRLRLRVGDRLGMITFADAGSQLAVEVARAAVPGSDPETQPGPRTANLYATSGRLLWQEHPGREPLAADAPVRLTLNDEPPEAEAVREFPSWIVADTISLLDQRASSAIERELVAGRSALLGLRELADHRRKEVRLLALRCLDGLGDFELMVAALDEPEQRSAWPDYVAQLRAAVVRSPLAAAQVRTAMEKLHGSEGTTLYEMLWKYGDELKSEDAARLVRALDHNTLAFRVVSYQTLKRITKLGLNYHPEDPAVRRRPWIQKWKERLSSDSQLGTQSQDTGQTRPAAATPSTEAFLPGMEN